MDEDNLCENCGEKPAVFQLELSRIDNDQMVEITRVCSSACLSEYIATNWDRYFYDQLEGS